MANSAKSNQISIFRSKQKELDIIAEAEKLYQDFLPSLDAEEFDQIENFLLSEGDDFIKKIHSILDAGKQAFNEKKYIILLGLIQKCMPKPIQLPADKEKSTEETVETVESLRAERDELERQLEQERIEKENLLKLVQQQSLTKEKIRVIIANTEGFRFLEKIVNLGEPTKELPKEIPASKKWDARAKEYQDMIPEEKARKYLVDHWMNYPVNLSYFKNSNQGSGFYKFLDRNDIIYLLPTACEQEIMRRLEN